MTIKTLSGLSIPHGRINKLASSIKGSVSYGLGAEISLPLPRRRMEKYSGRVAFSRSVAMITPLCDGLGDTWIFTRDSAKSLPGQTKIHPVDSVY